MKPSLVVAALLALPAASAASQQPAYDRSKALPARVPITRDAEVKMARAAAPAAVSDRATIYLAGPRGYQVAHLGTNGWGCFVQRGGSGKGFFPRCDDAERVATLYPVYFLLEEYRAAGKSAADYDAAVADGYRSGRYRAPAVGALSYMLAEGAIKAHVMGRGAGVPGHATGPGKRRADEGLDAHHRVPRTRRP
ncbi:MAG TPA: hypothetical protein VF981_11660 [Gemmatimonadaceae bacterium]